MKKAGTSEKDKAIAEQLKNPSFNYEEEQKKIAEALGNSSVDAAEQDNVIDLTAEKEAKEDAPAAFSDPEENAGHQNLPREFYEKQQEKGFQPAIEVTTKKSGFSSRDTSQQFDNLLGKRTFKDLSPEEKEVYLNKELAKPASEQDLSNLDESMIMSLPQIKANSFKVIDILNPKPKDPNMRFKWANCKNHVAGNLGRYISLGFQVASVDDVDTDKTPVDPSMIDGTQIKYYDVILLKINVLELMSLYKTNVVKSIMRLGRIKEKGIAEANRQFRNDISNESGASSAYNKIKQAIGGREPVEFFTPGLDESEVASR